VETSIGPSVTLVVDGRGRLGRERTRVRQFAPEPRVESLVDQEELALGLGKHAPRVGDALLELALEVSQHVVGLLGQDRGKQSPASHVIHSNAASRE